MAEKIVEVTTQMGAGWKVTAQIRDHLLIIDQPTGTNEGANPLETFLFSLAGCISTIAKMVAREQKLELRGIEVKVSAAMNSAGLLGQPTDDPVGFKRIDIIADIDADMSQDEKTAFLDLVCARCPVHDNLLSPTLVYHETA
ncbi:OsmC family protein [Shewanella sp. GXUN23E]|uniref:OsmC family protein n=1 Tax=Shewanella sp. GXUN23E TaxID=3422498 RepID=UPI003D7C9263